MPEDGIPRSILILVLILAGGFFAGSETALSYCNKIRMRSLADNGGRRAKSVVYILDRFDDALVTILIGNNVLHVAAASVATLLAVSMMGNSGSVVSTVALTLLVFLFSETIPKNFAKARCDSFALAAAIPLRGLMYLLWPFEKVFSFISNGLKKLFGQSEKVPTMTGDEFQDMIETIEEEGGIEPEESRIIRQAVDFADIRAKDVMTPVEKVVSIDINSPLDDVRETLLREKYSRLPVCDGKIDEIVGILQTSDCLLELKRTGTIDIASAISLPYRINPETRVDVLFEGMRRLRSHIAIVKGPRGTTLGIVTMEDVLEEIVGDIFDEDEKPEAEVK